MGTLINSFNLIFFGSNFLFGGSCFLFRGFFFSQNWFSLFGLFNFLRLTLFGLEEAEAWAARTLEQELHSLSLSQPTLCSIHTFNRNRSIFCERGECTSIWKASYYFFLLYSIIFHILLNFIFSLPFIMGFLFSHFQLW